MPRNPQTRWDLPNSLFEAGYNVTSSAVGTDKAIFDYGDYTVGSICALPTELAAAKAMLDEQHQALPARSKDNNMFVLG
ncbi:hypothetical protein FOCG_10322 [Fusarium oxysporum f. sp. radicis-lycopersici 26381]|uniref:Uncharacterized protein n=1 Tax=Fusarium oxysporum Fo47 TaxID=660027 RepID=W9JQ22_FUSOX|nr:hypothetical protein FOZG_12118 [Fusarium oxysporum Fo47]EWZ79941.1 hypothetical protein FOWG_15964 [Fusarium oxysporum f. sp. lycopersici MN25]EXL47800.1 hypothetical protein FOCG_10322 [Fusarium oxysporum f. sp. radicis-lycopersici 26381]